MLTREQKHDAGKLDRDDRAGDSESIDESLLHLGPLYRLPELRAAKYRCVSATAGNRRIPGLSIWYGATANRVTPGWDHAQFLVKVPLSMEKSWASATKGGKLLLETD